MLQLIRISGWGWTLHIPTSWDILFQLGSTCSDSFSRFMKCYLYKVEKGHEVKVVWWKWMELTLSKMRVLRKFMSTKFKVNVKYQVYVMCSQDSLPINLDRIMYGFTFRPARLKRSRLKVHKPIVYEPCEPNKTYLLSILVSSFGFPPHMPPDTA